MRQFADEYLTTVILPLSTAELQYTENQQSTISQFITFQLEGLTPKLFFGVEFLSVGCTHSQLKADKNR
jgi:hypothetical protein